MSHRLPDLKMGKIKLTFQAEGNTPEDRDLLKRIDKGSERIDEHSLKINGGTLSGPEENFDGKEDKALQTFVSESCMIYLLKKGRTEKLGSYDR